MNKEAELNRLREQSFMLVDMCREQDRALRVSVMIPHDEVDRLMVNRLIKIRNSDANWKEDMSHFDKVLRHFLSEDEFKKHVEGNEAFEHE